MHHWVACSCSSLLINFFPGLHQILLIEPHWLKWLSQVAEHEKTSMAAKLRGGWYRETLPLAGKGLDWKAARRRRSWQRKNRPRAPQIRSRVKVVLRLCFMLAGEVWEHRDQVAYIVYRNICTEFRNLRSKWDTPSRGNTFTPSEEY